MKAFYILLTIMVLSTWVTQGAGAESHPQKTRSVSAQAGGRKLGVGTPAAHTGPVTHGPGSGSPGLTRASAGTVGQRPATGGSSSINGTGIRIRSSSVNGTTIRSKHWPRLK
jgi:hypothetical protein